MILTPVEVGRFFPRSSTPTIVPYAEGAQMRESAVLLGDGRVLYVFCQAGAVRQGYAPSLRRFFAADGSVTGVTDILTGISDASSVVFWASGSLRLVVAGSNIARIDLYTSPSGVGGDWALTTTIDGPSPTGSTETSNFNLMAVGQPHIAGDTWVLPAHHYNYAGIIGLYRVSKAAFTSTDAGATWTRVWDTGYYSFGAYGDGGGRNVGETIDGRLWVSSEGFASGNQMGVSVDGGSGFSTWYGAHDDWTFVCGDTDGYLYRFSSGAVLARSLDPLAGSWEVIRDYNLSTSTHQLIMQRIGPFAFISAAGRCLRMSSEVPPLRGRQRDDLRGRQRRSQQLSDRVGWGNAYL